jgi:hypothetical protein
LSPSSSPPPFWGMQAVPDEADVVGICSAVVGGGGGATVCVVVTGRGGGAD